MQFTAHIPTAALFQIPQLLISEFHLGDDLQLKSCRCQGGPLSHIVREKRAFIGQSFDFRALNHVHWHFNYELLNNWLPELTEVKYVLRVGTEQFLSSPNNCN